MALSKIIHVRLRADEDEMLSSLQISETRGTLNASEIIRYLIRSEFNRTHGKSRPGPVWYLSDLRNGRPKRKVKNENKS